jgi:hypothetical protein
MTGGEGEGIRDVKKQQEVGITTETAKTRGDDKNTERDTRTT